jgi:acyl-CoA synthetase (AMP-forming)/AMP-acid ligase II
LQPIDWLYRTTRINRNAIAIDAPGIELSYGDLVAQVDALAVALQALDPAPQSRIGVCGHNTVEHLLSILAVMAAGKVWVPLNPLDPSSELKSKLALSRPSLIVTDRDCLLAVEDADTAVIFGACDPREHDPAKTVAGLIKKHLGESPARTSLDRTAIQALKFTGGSSGAPKGVLQPYRAWIAGARNMLTAHRFDTTDRFLLAAPLTHGTSCYVTPMLAAGGTLVLLGGRAKPDAILDAFAGRNVTATFLPPTLIYMLVSALDDAHEDFSSLRLLIYGAAPMPPERVREAQSLFGPIIGANYGLTEAPQIITALRPEEANDERLASAGRAGVSNRVEIMSLDGRILPPGESGEVVVSGDLVMSGYLDLPRQTAEALKEGWLHTGDLGHLDERGFLYITDRIKDLIISGGFNVYPGEVERVLAAHPAVSECVVFGMADEKWGEAVHAAITLRSGQSADVDDIISFAKKSIGSVKAPKRIHVLDDMPVSSVGKVQRRKVREFVTRRAAR